MALHHHLLLKQFLPFHHRPRSLDLDKPNFVFSSDIPVKVGDVVNNYFNNHYDDQASEDIVDLADKIIEFNVNIELNTLLMRNRSLRPSDLIKEKLIFLAKSAVRHNSSDKRKDVPTFNPASPSSRIGSLYMFPTNETFIVSLSLKLLDFIISIKELENFRIDFLKDENYGLLLLCDEQLIDQLEDYIKKRFIYEIKQKLTPKKVVKRPKERVNSASTAVDSSDNEETSPTNTENEDASTIVERLPVLSNSVSMTDISINEDSFRNDNSKINNSDFLDQEDKFSSTDNIELIKSNDTTCSTNIDDNDNDDHDMQDITRDKPYKLNDNILSGLNYISNPNINLKTKLQKLNIKHREDDFLDNVNNLRHNEENDSLILDDINAFGCDLHDFNNPEATFDLEVSLNSINDNDEPYNTLHKTQKGEFNQLLSLKPPIDLRPNDILDTPLTSPLKLTRNSSSFTSPSKMMTSRRTSTTSFSMINTEDKDLEFAFKNKSPMVPSYIKEDKKFKFIKVGKVQKFVNLFEEKRMDDNVASRHQSRTNTRPSSPLKKQRKDIFTEE